MRKIPGQLLEGKENLQVIKNSAKVVRQVVERQTFKSSNNNILSLLP